MSLNESITAATPAAPPEATRPTLRRLKDLAHTWTASRPHLIVVAATLGVFAGAYFVAFLIRFEFHLPATYQPFFEGSIAWVVGIKLLVFYFLGLYRILWAYLGLRDLYRILGATVLASGAVAATNWILFPVQLVPRSVMLSDGLLTFLGIGGLFALLRSARETRALMAPAAGPSEPVFIVGAGNAGESLLRELQRNPSAGVRVVAFLDDDPAKQGQRIRGIPVGGVPADAAALAEVHGARKAYIAIPSASGSAIRKIVNGLLAAKLAIKILPPLTQLSSGAGMATQLREVSIEDLLRREPVKLDTAAISAFVKDKTVLVTGAAGSIGSELCRQILDWHPRKLVALDLAETPLQTLLLELQGTVHGDRLTGELGDVTDVERVRGVFEAHRPEVVFHAAALKHVPLMESHPREAVRVNVGGTKAVAEAARDFGAGAFILISTDKAVNPTSVMGATKRVAELLVQKLARGVASAGKGPRYMAVRFGNVLGSNGSVLTIWKAQLAKGGPLTVTHPEMKRYFMTIPEAVQLVLQAAVMGEGSEVFVLNMGEAVRILDLARDLIRLSGRIPGVDLGITVSGIRPGERLEEALWFDSESHLSTPHPKINRLRAASAREAGIEPGLLKHVADLGDVPEWIA